ncbi:MAG: pyruvate flavodoxin/ferredoxin oxidoreductase [Acidimicrobiia bacterium]|nr:pyruvate flavodoxin/ferredoxin oxidoreductase [Acidimicrobiia bacterium]
MAHEFIDGSTAIVRGALAAGCDFFAGYPITPASPILQMMMTELPARGGIAIQGEDEIASIGMCIGATLGGARTFTATSGPGISLYSENIGLAIIGEIPLVIVDVQRLGPATGGATTVGQGDVQFVRWGTAGGYPIIALAPSKVEECYTLTMRAFDLAERFRCPVFLLTDKDLNMTMRTVDPAALTEWAVRDRNYRKGDEGPQYRYQPPDGVPPIGRYGDEIVRFTGSSHNEDAVITKNPATVGALNEHLAAKIDDHLDEIEMVTLDHQDGAATLILAYGATAGAARAAVRQTRADGGRVSLLVVQSLWPVPEQAIKTALAGVSRVVAPELNLGLYRREIERLASGHQIVGVNRVDGKLITPEQIIEVLS